MKNKYFVCDEKQFDKEYDVVMMERKLEETKTNRLELCCEIEDKMNLIFEIIHVLYCKANERTKNMLHSIIFNGLNDIAAKRILLGDSIDRSEEVLFACWNEKCGRIHKMLEGDKDEDDR